MKIFSKSRAQNSALIIPALLLVLGIAFASLVAWQQRINNQTELQVLFDEEAKTLVDSTLSHIRTYKNPLLGIRGVVVAYGNNNISRQAFKNFAASRNMDIEYPAARGFGFIRRVAREQEADFLKQARADDMPDFAIKDFSLHNGDHYIIQYIEPASRNYSAIGLDIASESSRRNAARQAMQTGDAILTSPITLVQSSGLDLRSLLLLLPIYHLNLPLDNATQREAATLGWSFAPIVIDDVMQHSGVGIDKQIDLQITDVSSNENMLTFYSPADFENLTQVSLKAQFHRTIFGRAWVFNLHAEPAFYHNHEKLSPLWLASFIVFFAFLLSLLLYFYLIYSQRLIAELQERNRLAAIVDNATDAIIRSDLDGVVISWNNAAYLMFDFTVKEAIGKKICELIIPEEMLKYKDAFLTKVRRGEPLSRFETVRKTRTGNQISVSVNPFLIKDKNGDVVGVAETLTDIRQQQKLQSELQNTLARMKMAVSSMNLGIWEWQLEDNKLIWDDRMFEIYDAPKNLAETGLYYDFWRSCVHPDDFDYAEQKLLEAITETDVYNLEFRILVNDGSIRYIQAAAIVERNAQGKAIQMVGINLDITERKQNEDALLQLTTKLELKVVERTQAFLDFYNQAPCAYHSMALDGTILQANQTELDLLGYASEEFIGHPIAEFLTPEGIENFKLDFPEFLKIGKVHNLEYDLVCKDGNIVPFLINASLVRDAQGHILYTTSTLIDNRERKAQEAQIAQLNTDLIHRAEEAESVTRAKTDFLSNMSHEIRTPMNAMLGLTYLLQKKPLLPEDRGMVEKIDLAGRSLLNVINNCLDVSKIESNLLVLEEIPFQLIDVFDNLSNIMSVAVGGFVAQIKIMPIFPNPKSFKA